LRLLFLNRSFWPDPEATGQFLTELCDDLSHEHEVTFIAGPSLFASRGSRRLFQREMRGHVAILRTWGTRLSKTVLAARVLNLASFYLLSAAAGFCAARPDVIVAETDPPLLGMLGALLKRRFGCRLVYNVRDLYPDIAIANGGLRNPLLLALLDRANRIAFSHADLVVTVGHDMARRIADKGVAAEKLRVIPDWADCARIRPLEHNRLRAEFGERFVVMYSGNLGLSQQLDTVIEAAARLRADPRIVFVLIGEGARKAALIELVGRRRLENVLFLPFRPKEQLAESLGAADLHLIPLISGASGCMLPSKVYGILAAGRPFIAMMDEHAEVARLAAENRVGLVVPAGDSAALARAVLEAAKEPAELRMMGSRARRLAEQRFDRRGVTREFAAMLESVVASA
jgi:putative colanic acid biosynthesis glycosyltransferase WcaI